MLSNLQKTNDGANFEVGIQADVIHNYYALKDHT